ncbi:MAG: DUF1600 domain-containing protein [Mycoplasmataceae bacterium]|jgi:hypothetical protein|nr:DUF1600 domain-containing protein [Mycoplasmataceae bacterium]
MITIIQKYKEQNKCGKARLFMGLICLIIMTAGILMYFVACFLPLHPQHPGQRSGPSYPWFGFFSYLAILSGLICTVFLFLWFANFYKHFKFMKSNTFQICACAYATLVFILYNALLFPTVVNDPSSWDYFPLGRVWWWISNMCVHTIGPLLMIAFFILSLKSKSDQIVIKKSCKRTLSFGLIFPLIYMIYLILLFFLAHTSIYGDTTAFWNFNDIKDNIGNGGIKGSPINLLDPVLSMILISAIISLYWWLNKKYIK